MTEARAFALRLAPVVGGIMAEGHTSVRAVTEALNARGVPSRESGRWHLRSTHVLLKRLTRDGVAEGTQRVVTDNCQTLRHRDHGFEEE